MREDIKKAILDSFGVRGRAAKVQAEKGVTDTGNRAGVTSGKHLDPLTDLIVDDIQSFGLNSDEIVSGNKAEIPGWFRATKKWDIVATRD